MLTYSHTVIIGFLGRDPSSGQTERGAVTNFDVATKRSWKDSSGNWQEKTEWHRCNAWGGVAEHAMKLRKGGAVLVEGAYETKKWFTRDGQERETKELMVARVIDLSQRKRDGGGSNIPNDDLAGEAEC